MLQLTMLDDHIPSYPPVDRDTKAILEWLALAHGRTGAEDADELHHQLLLLRESPTPAGQRVKLLTLLYGHAERIVQAELPNLHEITLPLSRKLRQRVRIVGDLLETLTQEYFSSLSELFDPRNKSLPINPQTTLRRTVQCIAWHIRISHLIAAPNGAGLWLQLHSAYRTACRLGLRDTTGPAGEQTIQQAYVHILLAAIAQPASFSSRELEFIADYIATSVKPVDLLNIPPLDRSGVFWIDLDKDFPACPQSRRPTPKDIPALYFACDLIARDARSHLDALNNGTTGASLGLPAFAETPAGRGVLRRLNQLWGQPAARRFLRRRQFYRIKLCAGLPQLWQLLRHPENDNQISEWMVTNESPEGYALMHVSGQTTHLRVGDIVAIQPMGERAEKTRHWHVGIVRWAISENPEHLELGMQQLASHAIAAEVIRPLELESGNLSALILPEMPPLRPLQALVTATGQINAQERRLTLLVEQDNIGIREVRPTALTEQTSSIEIISVEADENS